MRVFAGIQLGGLIDAFSNSAVSANAMDRKGTGIVVSRQQILAFYIDAGVDRTGWKVLRFTVRCEHAASRVDAECMREVLIARHARTSDAGHDVQVSFGRVRPSILD